MKGRSRLAIDDHRRVRHAIEVRHQSFVDPDFICLLREHDVALVIAETARKWPMMHDITADFVYMRLHGDKELYRSGYSDAALNRWAKRVAAWHRGAEPKDAQKISRQKPPTARPRDVFCFFDNTDVKLRAPVDAQSLMRKLHLQPGTPPLASRCRCPEAIAGSSPESLNRTELHFDNPSAAIFELRIPVRAAPFGRHIENGPERHQVGRAARILAGVGGFGSPSRRPRSAGSFRRGA